VSVRRTILNRLRSINKYTLNHMTRRFAGKPRSPLAKIRHIGSKSGKAYETPVIAQKTNRSFIIPIAYGTDSDWYHNVLTAGHCKILWRGKEYTLTDPRPVDAQSVIREFPVFPQQLMLRILGTDHVIKMDLVTGAD
jgi:deazaflavin-dependent oxidoreductase (nitroreductase family)